MTVDFYRLFHSQERAERLASLDPNTDDSFAFSSQLVLSISVSVRVFFENFR